MTVLWYIAPFALSFNAYQGIYLSVLYSIKCLEHEESEETGKTGKGDAATELGSSTS